MSKFETIATFTLPSELAVAKSKLESEGITCRVLDELTVQSHNFLSNAVGGVKLQVESKNTEQAIAILKAGGFKIESNELSAFEKKLGSPVFYKRLKIFSYVFFSIFGIIFISFLAISIYNQPTNRESLIQGNWCLDHIEYAEQVYFPNTLSDKIQIITINDCIEHIDFKSDGKLIIPGFESIALNGNWTLTDNHLRIFNLDTLKFAFEREYSYSLSNRELILTSDSTNIFCYKSGY